MNGENDVAIPYSALLQFIADFHKKIGTRKQKKMIAKVSRIKK